MNPLTGNITDIAHAIQVAIAPVFLLTGIAGILNVMTGRLARILQPHWPRRTHALKPALRPGATASRACPVPAIRLQTRHSAGWRRQAVKSSR